MMPVSGDHSAPMQNNSASMARAVLPPIISVFSTPLICAWVRDRRDLGKFGLIGRHDELAAFVVRDAMGGAELVEHAPAAHAVQRAQRIRRIVEAGVNHLAVARGDAVGDAARNLGDRDVVSAQRRRARNRKPDDAGADHKDLHRVSSHRHCGGQSSSISIGRPLIER